ncbi:MAG: hypothetical protein K2O28_01120 [Clostridia bacterium]|nr:hypothetical protein [Clostridia bacterium]
MSEEVKEYTAEDIQSQIKPLSGNAFVRFFQKILRWWLGVWYGFCDKKPKFSALVYKVFFFVVFSMGVTIWQFIIMAVVPLFLPKTGPVGWPMIPIGAAGGNEFIIFGDQDGWATFICFEIAVFTAQCINFPLQRNITYRSHGNPWFQAMWYFIGWVLVSVATNALWGVCNAFLLHWGSPDIVNGLLKTVLTGGVSMVIFFFIFMVIFPDNNKMAKKARAKYEKLVAANAPAEKVAKAEAKMNLWEDKALKNNAEKEYAKAKSQVNAKAMTYFAIVKASENPKLKEEEKAAYPEKIQKAFDNAVEAIKIKNEKEEAFNALNDTKEEK